MSPIDIRPSPTFNMIKILQGYTNRVRWANYILYPEAANFLQCKHAKNYDSWLSV